MAAVERTSAVLTTEEAAALVRVPQGWLEDKGRAGEIPGRIKIGHYVRWDEKALVDWLASLVQPANCVGRTELSKAQAAAKKRRAA